MEKFCYLCIVGIEKAISLTPRTLQHHRPMVYTTATLATTEIADALRNALAKGVVKFTFFKKDGSIREAYGTRNLAVASTRLGGVSIHKPYGKPNPNCYYDLEKQAWRAFIPENVCSIDV